MAKCVARNSQADDQQRREMGPVLTSIGGDLPASSATVYPWDVRESEGSGNKGTLANAADKISMESRENSFPGLRFSRITRSIQTTNV